MYTKKSKREIVEYAARRQRALRWANLSGANLEGTNLYGTNLHDANLSGANLSGADLSGANLYGTNLEGTILDPGAAMPETDMSAFERAGDGRLIGYRTHRSRYVGDTEYRAGETYTAPIFSICTKTDCHPGLYIYPLAQLPGEYAGYGVVKVLFRAEDALNAGDKYRCKSFEVVETLEDANI